MATTDSAVPPRSRREELLHRFEDLTEWPLLFLSVLMIPLLLVPLVTSVSHSTDQGIETVLWITWGVFAVELSIRTYLATNRVNYLIRNWPDVLIVAVPFLRPLRVARSARALRVLRLARVGPFMIRAFTSAHQVLKHRGLQYVLLLGLLMIFGSAGMVTLLEQGRGSRLDDYGTALWWAMTTITTVGYGDTVPQTPEGKGIAVVLMVFGIAFFSWVTANMAAFLLEFGGGENTGRSVTTQDLMRKLEALEGEIQMLRAGQTDVIDSKESGDAFLD